MGIRPGGVHVESAGPMQIVPLRLVLAVAVEHLDTMVLPVGAQPSLLSSGGNVMHDVQLPGSQPARPRRKAVFRRGECLCTREFP